MTKIRSIATMIAAACGAVALVGCADGPSDSPDARDGSVADRLDGSADDTGNGRVDRGAIGQIFGNSTYDYNEYPETEDLADGRPTNVALTGQVTGFSLAPDMFADDAGDRDVFMTVESTDVFDGSPAGSTITVLFNFSARVTLEQLGKAFPNGAPVALYLNRATGLPNGTGPAWVARSPQGFVTEDEEGVIFPSDQELNSEETLEEQVPEGVTLP